MQDDWEHGSTESMSSSSYYLLPCFFLFSYSSELLYLVLNSLKILIAEEVSLLVPDHTHSTSNHLKSTYTVLSLLLMMHEDMKMKRILLSQKTHVRSIMEEVIKFQVSLLGCLLCGQISFLLESMIYLFDWTYHGYLLPKVNFLLNFSYVAYCICGICRSVYVVNTVYQMHYWVVLNPTNDWW